MRLPRRRLIIRGSENKLKTELDLLCKKYNTKEFILDDPVQFPRRFKKKRDIETAAFLSATIAWGRRKMIIKSAEKMFAILGKSPYDFLMKNEFKKTAKKERGQNIHRTFFEDDLRYFCRGLKFCYEKYCDLENLFASRQNVWEGIYLFRETMAQGNGGAYSKHISNPESASACKRLHLALRWLVRNDGIVDLGLWKKIAPASLFIPLDLHVGRSARSLGLLDKNCKANGKNAVISLTEKLREFCPEDPVKYDFALFGYSILH